MGRESLEDLWGTAHRSTNDCLIAVVEKERVAERIFEEIVAENFTGLIKDMNINIQEVQRTLIG